MIQFFRTYILGLSKPVSRGKKPPTTTKRLMSASGQVGLVLILLAALGLVFYAMSLNLNKVSEAKIKTMVAAERATSFMASFMASYAQKMSEEQLKGGLGFCKSTSLLGAILKAVVMIALAIAFPGGGVGTALAISAGLATAAAVVEAVYIQPTLTDMWNKMMLERLSTEGQLIEYGVQYALRSVVDDDVEFPDLLDSDMDGVFVPYSTVDKDGKPLTEGARMEQPYKDTASRFNYHYTQRLKQIERLGIAPLDEFTKQLTDFIYFYDTQSEEGDGSPDIWGIHDGPRYSILSDGRDLIPAWGEVENTSHPCHPDSGLTTPAECDSQCVPSAVEACCDYQGCPSEVTCATYWPSYVPGDDSPECCASCAEPYDTSLQSNPICQFSGSGGSGCGSRSYMGDDFALVYDPYYQDTTNSVVSLLEFLGKDDLSPVHQVNDQAPDWHLNAGSDVNSHQTVKSFISPHPPTSDSNGMHNTANRELADFEARDASGFWQGDSQQGIFPFLYTMKEIGVDLSDADANGYAGRQCYWRAGSCALVSDGMGDYDDPDKNAPRLYALQGPVSGAGGIVPDTAITLEMPDYPLGDAAGDERVVSLGAGGRPDIVRDPAGLFLTDSDCGLGGWGWKRGTDAFCSDPLEPSPLGVVPNPGYNYPYNVECPKNGFDAFSGDYGTSACTDSETGELTDCACGASGAWNEEYFNNDGLDDLYYGLPEFLAWAENLLSMIGSSATKYAMRYNVAEWYGEAAKWFDSSNGSLPVWRDELKQYYDIFNDWIFPDDVSKYSGTTTDCLDLNQVWCVPAEQTSGVVNEHGLNECIGVTPEEQQTFNVNENDPDSPGHLVRGDLEDVVACMEWNIYDETSFVNAAGTTVTAQGNQEKFQACADNCGPWACQELPRSVILMSFAGATWLETAVRNEINSYWSDQQLYTNCMNAQTYHECDARCRPKSHAGPLGPGPLPTINSVDSVPYTTNGVAYGEPDLTQIDIITDKYEQWQQDCADGITFSSSNPMTLSCNGFNYDVTGCEDEPPPSSIIPQAYKFDNCRDSYGGSCEALVGDSAPGTSYSGETSDYVDAVSDVVLNGNPNDTTGFCHRDDDGVNGPDFLEWVQRSADKAENIVKKLEQRYRFLNYALTEGLKLRDFFGEATDRFSEFLDNHTAADVGPAADDSILGSGYTDENRARDVEWHTEGEHQLDATTGLPRSATVYDDYNVDSPLELLQALRDEQEEEGHGDLPSVAIYVWRGPDLSWDARRPDTGIGGELQRGYLHAVKVEVRAPKRCNNACDPSGTGYQKWPWIHTKTKNWGTKRCYSLRDYSGRVKTRVIRYDEPIDTRNRAFQFANGVQVSGMLLTHPDADPGNEGGFFSGGDPSVAASPCYQQIDPYILMVGKEVAASGGEQFLHHVIMLNDVPEKSDGSGDAYDQCWWDVHVRFLEKGVHSESCAMYVWEGRDMGIRFVPCDNDFVNGHN